MAVGVDPEALRTAVEQAYGCEARTRGVVPVTDRERGVLIWEGLVYVFDIDGCSSAKIAYAWWSKGRGQPPVIVTALGVPPVMTAADAVRSVLLPADFEEHRPAGNGNETGLPVRQSNGSRTPLPHP